MVCVRPINVIWIFFITSDPMPSCSADPMFTKMCCEQMECYAAVFDHEEALCYLKGADAMATSHFQSLDGFTSYEMFLRTGMYGTL